MSRISPFDFSFSVIFLNNPHHALKEENNHFHLCHPSEILLSAGFFFSPSLQILNNTFPLAFLDNCLFCEKFHILHWEKKQWGGLWNCSARKSPAVCAVPIRERIQLSAKWKTVTHSAKVNASLLEFRLGDWCLPTYHSLLLRWWVFPSR